MWLSASKDAVIRRVKSVDNELRVLNEFANVAYNAAVGTSKHILMAVEGKTKLQVMNRISGEMSDSVYDVKPLQPKSFLLTDTDGVIVRALNDTREKGTIILFDVKGCRIRVFDTDEDNEPLFNYPLRTKITRNGLIHVVDCKVDFSFGKLTVLNMDGRLINAYCGHPEVNKDLIFRPQGLAITQKDNVLIADLDTHIIHVLNNRGRLLSLINVGYIGIRLPATLVISSDGTLYIGCSTKEGETNAQLCIVDSPSIEI